MNTLVLVLSACIGQSGEEAPMPLWQRDYGQAQKQATQAQKPLAVFLAPGQNGLERLIPDGLSNQAKEMMMNKFVCVLIDTNTPNGKRLAEAFEIGNMGIVISDRSGAYQAYWQQGTLSIPALVRNLQRFADQTTVRITEIGGRPSFYPSNNPPGIGQYQSGNGYYQGDQPNWYNDQPRYRGGRFGRNRY